MPRIEYRDGRPAVCVKDHVLWARDPRTTELIATIGVAITDAIYRDVAEGFWHSDAPEIARSHGYGGEVYSAGRSGGWLYLGDAMSWPEYTVDRELTIPAYVAPEPPADWRPSFASWRHGGWYVTNVRYASGAVGCVSRNYADRKWRIACDPREGSFLGGPNDHAYPSRDAAARAEWSIANTDEETRLEYEQARASRAQFLKFAAEIDAAVKDAGDQFVERLREYVDSEAREVSERAYWEARDVVTVEA